MSAFFPFFCGQRGIEGSLRLKKLSRLLEEAGDRPDHVVDLVGRELREDGHGERLARRALADRKRAIAVPERGEALLAVERQRVVDLGADLPLLQVLDQGI